MKCTGLVTGVEHCSGIAKASGKPFDFHKLNFVDTENPSGSPQSATLPSDPVLLQKALQVLEKARLTVVSFNVFQNGNYVNFGGICEK